MMSMYGKRNFAAAVAAVGLSIALPGLSQACSPPLPMTAAEEEAQDLAIQAGLWAQSDMIFAATVSAVLPDGDASGPSSSASSPPMPGQERIRVQLTPTALVKGDQPLPATYEIRDIFVGCVPRGIQRAQVGQRYLVYGQPSRELSRAGGIVEVDRLRDAETLAAVQKVAALAAIAR